MVEENGLDSAILIHLMKDYFAVYSSDLISNYLNVNSMYFKLEFFFISFNILSGSDQTLRSRYYII